MSDNYAKSEGWGREVVIDTLEKLKIQQHGKDQVCLFCGTPYQLGEGEVYRPQAVCADCWPKVSAIDLAEGARKS